MVAREGGLAIANAACTPDRIGLCDEQPIIRNAFLLV